MRSGGVKFVLLAMWVTLPSNTVSVVLPKHQGLKTRVAQSGGLFSEIENLKNNIFSFITKGFGSRPPQGAPPLQPPLGHRPNHGPKPPPPPRPVHLPPPNPPKNPLPLPPPNFPDSFSSFNPQPPTSSFQHPTSFGGSNVHRPQIDNNFGFQGPPVESFPPVEFSFGEIPAPSLGPTPAPAPIHPVRPAITEENYHLPASVQQFGAPAFFDPTKEHEGEGSADANVTPFVDLTGELELGGQGDIHSHTLTDSQRETLLSNVIDQDLLDRIKHNLWREDVKNTPLAKNKKTHLNTPSTRRLLKSPSTTTFRRVQPELKTLSDLEVDNDTLGSLQISEAEPKEVVGTDSVNFGFMDPSLFTDFTV